MRKQPSRADIITTARQIPLTPPVNMAVLFFNLNQRTDSGHVGMLP